MVRDQGLEQAFYPKAIAIVGVSRTDDDHPPGYTGLAFLRLLQQAGFEGRVFPVNPKASLIEGTRVYPSIISLPEPLDLVIVAVPAASVPQVLEDCIEAGVRNVHICTAGFGETGEPEGREMENRIRQIALRGGLRIIGPNCLGLHVPSIRMKMYENVPLAQGPVAFISQSGGHAQTFLGQGPPLGIGFSKVISYGNALMMDSTDFLEYLATDPETQIICMYIEGVKDGNKLTNLVRQLNLKKPVVIWKGGLTSSGARAAATHTGSLAGDRQIWNSFFKQTGAIRVGSTEEMADVCMTFLRVKPLSGRRVAVFGGGGGNNVATGDTCAEEGLEVLALSEETRRWLMEFVSLVNQSVINPLDAGTVFAEASRLRRATEIVAADPGVDMIILHMGADFANWLSAEAWARFKKCAAEMTQENPAGKPLIMAAQGLGKAGDTERFAQELREAGLTVYGSLLRACRALSRFAAYHQFIAESGKGNG